MQKHITPFWDDFYKSLTYETSLFKDPEQLAVWESAGHHIPSTAIDICQFKNPHPEFIKNFDLKNIGVCVHRLRPGHYLPMHIDKYEFYKNNNNIDSLTQIHRFVIFLEDWKIGHYLQVLDKIHVGWKKGDCIGWAGETPHSAINLGTADRYTLQITGEYAS
jgi:hypothetical protein